MQFCRKKYFFLARQWTDADWLYQFGYYSFTRSKIEGASLQIYSLARHVAPPTAFATSFWKRVSQIDGNCDDKFCCSKSSNILKKTFSIFLSSCQSGWRRTISIGTQIFNWNEFLIRLFMCKCITDVFNILHHSDQISGSQFSQFFTAPKIFRVF